MTQNDEIKLTYAAGVKLSAAMNAATIVLLRGTVSDIQVVGCETLTCSSHLREVWKWIDKQTDGGNVDIVVGVDSSMLRFLEIRIPAVDPRQQYPLIQIQAEAALPLSADQITLAWQAEPDASEGLLCRTVAARKELLQSVLAKSEPIRAAAPEAVGLATAWKHFGCNPEQPCILLHRRESDFLVAMLQEGHLRRSAVIDADGVDLREELPSGLLIQDILAEIEAMPGGREHALPLYILSEKAQDDFLDSLCMQVQGAGWKTEMAFLEDFSGWDGGVESLEAFGLALSAMNTEPVDYDFLQVKVLEQPENTQPAARTQLRKAVVITITLLVIGLGISYWGIKKDVKMLHQVMTVSHEGLTVQQVLTEQAYRETVARARPDITDLFERIQKCQEQTLLDAIEFEKGKPVKVTATADSYDAAYQFQKELETQNKNVITKSKLLEPRMDLKTKKVKFTITFQYRNFSQ